MPRNMSFSLTTEQMRKRTKTVTRRMGWGNIKPGEVLNACVKCQGLKKGETVEVIGQIRVLKVQAMPLDRITPDDCRREGFPQLTPLQFMSLFMSSHPGCRPDTLVNRIEFEHI